MLVISRKTEEFVQIGDNIVVKILKSTNGSVKIGIEAPGNQRILRGEMQEETTSLPKLLVRNRRTNFNEGMELESSRKAEAV